MRIVHVISAYLPYETTGTQILVRDLCRGLVARGHEVSIFTRLAGTDYGELEVSRADWEGVPVTRITNNFADVDRFERLYTHPTIDARFEEYLAATQPDVVHVHHLTCLSTSMIDVASRRNVPVVMALLDYWMVCLRGQRIRPDDLGVCEVLDRDRCLNCLQALWPHLLPTGLRSVVDRLLGRATAADKIAAWEAHIRRMFDRCQVLTSLSRFHRDRFLEFGLDADRVVLAPPGIADSLAGLRRPTRPRRHIGFIGSVIPSKGVHVLCDAFSRLNRTDLTLHIHGEAPAFHGDTHYVDRLRQSIPPDLQVEFHGRYEHADLPRILETLDVLVVPSLWWESYCLTAREGAVAGLPVIASYLGGLEDAVDDGIVVGFRPGDAGDLATQLARVIRDGFTPRMDGRYPKGVLTLDTSTARAEDIYRAVVDRRPVSIEPTVET